ncbi:MAG: hypothetical protein HEQ23_09060 [Tepidisphaera sp.]
MEASADTNLSRPAEPHPLIRMFNLFQTVPMAVRRLRAMAEWFDRLSDGGKKMPSEVYARRLKRKPLPKPKPGVYQHTIRDDFMLLKIDIDATRLCLQALPAAGEQMDQALNPGAMSWSVNLHRALFALSHQQQTVGFAWNGRGFNLKESVASLDRIDEIIRRSLGELIAVLELKGIASLGSSIDVQKLAGGKTVPKFDIPLEGLTVKVLCEIGDISEGSLKALRDAAGVSGRAQGEPFKLSEFRLMVSFCRSESAKPSWKKALSNWSERMGTGVLEASPTSLTPSPQRRTKP